MDHEDHVRYLGILVSYFHALEFALRAVLKNQEKGKVKKIVYSRLRKGDTVPEDAMTNYDSLGSLIDKYNKIAPKELTITKGIVATRDAIAHGRVFSDVQSLPVNLYKFDKPKNGTVTVAVAVTLDQNWFKDTGVHLYEEIQKVMRTNEKYA
jgi:hypothetical protein